MLPRTFHGWVAALAVSICAPATPANLAAAQEVTVYENLHLTQITVNNQQPNVQLEFDGQVCTDGTKTVTVQKGDDGYSMLVSIAMAALSSNRRLRVQSNRSPGWCRIESITLLK